MAQLVDVDSDENGVVTLNEPACGSGGLIIAYAEAMKVNKKNFQTQLKVICNDLDYDVVKMAYIQLSLLGIDAVIMQGNTLSLGFNEVWYTPMHVMNLAREQQEKRNERAFDSMKNIIDLADKEQKDVVPGQMNIFEFVD